MPVGQVLGGMQVRVRFLKPLPQAREHRVHSPHSVNVRAAVAGVVGASVVVVVVVAVTAPVHAVMFWQLVITSWQRLEPKIDIFSHLAIAQA